MTGGYSIEVADAPEGPFTVFAQSGKTTVIIDGRTPLKACYVRARAIGAAGSSPYCTVISMIAM